MLLAQELVSPDATRVDIVAIIGIAGTLLGTVIGAFVAAWVQRRQQEHEDRTRFHDRRLAVYADYNDACNKVIAGLVVAQHANAADVARYLQGFETVRLIASRAVSDAATVVHGTVGAALRGEILPNHCLPKFNSELATLCAAIRKEVGVVAD